MLIDKNWIRNNRKLLWWLGLNLLSYVFLLSHHTQFLTPILPIVLNAPASILGFFISFHISVVYKTDGIPSWAFIPTMMLLGYLQFFFFIPKAEKWWKANQ
jgi:hypothetical protein